MGQVIRFPIGRVTPSMRQIEAGLEAAFIENQRIAAELEAESRALIVLAEELANATAAYTASR